VQPVNVKTCLKVECNKIFYNKMRFCILRLAIFVWFSIKSLMVIDWTLKETRLNCLRATLYCNQDVGIAECYTVVAVH